VLIGAAAAEDLPRIVEIHEACWLDAYPAPERGIGVAEIASLLEPDGRRRLARWQQRLADPDGRLWVARADGEVVGFAGARDGWLEYLHVHPDAQSRGTGTALLRTALAWLGDGELRLGVVEYNERAIALYRRFGFEPAGVLPDSEAVFGNGAVLRDLLMVRAAQA
jgi:ribosomal protein S18 acetylase RimI-like enzyme